MCTVEEVIAVLNEIELGEWWGSECYDSTYAFGVTGEPKLPIFLPGTFAGWSTDDVRRYVTCRACGEIIRVRNAWSGTRTDRDGNLVLDQYCSDECATKHDEPVELKPADPSRLPPLPLPKLPTFPAFDSFTWRGKSYPSKSIFTSNDPVETLSERAHIGRERMIAATLRMWSGGGGAMTRPFAERYVDGLAAEVVAMVETLNAAAVGWETKADRSGWVKSTGVGTGEPWTVTVDGGWRPSDRIGR